MAAGKARFWLLFPLVWVLGEGPFVPFLCFDVILRRWEHDAHGHERMHQLRSIICRADATGRGSSAKDFIGSHGDEAIVTLSIVQVRLVFSLAFFPFLVSCAYPHAYPPIILRARVLRLQLTAETALRRDKSHLIRSQRPTFGG